MQWGIRRKLHVIPIAVTVLLVVALILMARVMRLYGEITYDEAIEHRALADMHVVIQQRLGNHFGQFSIAAGTALLDQNKTSIDATLASLAQQCAVLASDLEKLHKTSGLQATTVSMLARSREQ